MGIDAEMFVKLNYRINEEELQKKSYIFGSMFHYHLFLGYDDVHYHNPLEIVDEIHGDGYGPAYEFKTTENTSIVEIPLRGRYYGKGYERGPLMDYVGMAEFLEVLFPGQEIYYGGDSSGVEFILFNRKARADLIAHAVQVAHEPYNKYFSGDHEKHICPHCKVGMNQNGFKGNLGFFTCLGCGWNIDEISKTEIKSGYNLMEFSK